MESTIQTKKQTKPLSNHGSQIHNGYAWIPQETSVPFKQSLPCELRYAVEFVRPWVTPWNSKDTRVSYPKNQKSERIISIE